ncbi:9f411953-90c2-421d-896e-33a10aa5e9b7-CDS [Sclerotinia trifoliorum]|uniref:9f411953-90c2-421d-896e-33a10aa5e9b7-CDS n=1 Tax=Sclerotinia trifoliorum TaxID=28548 RepID=A0A8H2VNQ8_9HELO|nr:9f411953-90c2-421d-896e-33a10aa5e9b7-CDS [Sclerotinia trifoliorum]
MSSVHPTASEDSKPTPDTTSIITSNTKTGNQPLPDTQASPKRPLRPNAPSSFPSPIPSIPTAITLRASCGDRSFNRSSRQLCVLDSPGLRTPPQGSSSIYLTMSPLSTAPLPRRESHSDYFQEHRSRGSSRSRNGHDMLNVASGCVSPVLPTEGYSTTRPSPKESYITSNGYTCTTDSLPSILGGPKTPYKARRPSSDSLSMVKHKKRRKTEGARHRRCRGTCSRGIKKTTEEMAIEERSYSPNPWPPSQVVPTALKDTKVPNTRKSKYLSMRRDRRRFLSEPAAPIVSRRWSSVEVGTRQVKLPPLLKQDSAKHMQVKGPIFQNEIFNNTPLNERNRSSSFTAGAEYNDVVRSLRERLTTRKLPDSQKLMPSAITLRRPSASNRSDMSSTMATSGFLTTPGTGSVIPSISSRQATFMENQPHDSEAYIITREDVEAVMELLQTNLLNTREAHTPVSASHGPSVEEQSPRGTRLPSLSFTHKGMVPVVRHTPCEIQIYAAQSENSRETSQNGNTTTANVSPGISRSQTNIVDPANPGQFLEISQTEFGRLDRLSEEGSERSVHEVIWEERGSTESHLTERGHVHSEVGSSECSSKAHTPLLSARHDDARPCFQFLKSSKQDHRPREEKGAFDPKNARMSISKWSWQCESQANEDDGNLVTTTEQEPHKDHVISFPPLPRKSTNEWRSPLPDMSISIRDSKLLGGILPQMHESSHSHSLYSIGVDARTAPGPSPPMMSGMETTPTTRSSWLNETALSPPDRVSSWLTHSESGTLKRQKSDTHLPRQKSVVKAHPKAPARSGNAAAIGSSIGSFTRVRRRATSQDLPKSKKVSIFDNPLVKSDHNQERKTWFKSIQDIARPRLILHGEIEAAGSWSTLAARHASKDHAARSTPSPPASPHCNPKDEANHRNIQPTTSSSISEMFSPPRSSARQSLSMIQDKYPSFQKSDSKSHTSKTRKMSSPGMSVARESLLKIQERYPSPPKPDHSGIYDSVTGIKRRDKLECSRDCQHLLHNCDTCTRRGSEMSSPSVDWIG